MNRHKTLRSTFDDKNFKRSELSGIRKLLKPSYSLHTYPDIDLLFKRPDRKTIAAYPIPKI